MCCCDTCIHIFQKGSSLGGGTTSVDASISLLKEAKIFDPTIILPSEWLESKQNPGYSAGQERCAMCPATGGLKKCTCLLVAYCSTACQRNGWVKHKQTCKQTRKANKNKATAAAVPSASPGSDSSKDSALIMKTSLSSDLTESNTNASRSRECENDNPNIVFASNSWVQN